MLSIILALVLTKLSPCDPQIPFSANDLAILLPVEKAFSDSEGLSLGNTNLGFPSSANLAQILIAAVKEGAYVDSSLKSEKHWKLISFRYAPCIFTGKQRNPCEEQVRLVFQPKDLDLQRPAFRDYSIHVIYVLSEGNKPVKSEFLTFFQELKVLANGATLDLQLQIHPLLAQGGSNSFKYWSKIQSGLFQSLLAKRSPKKITMMALGKLESEGKEEQRDDHWIFLTGNVKNGDWVQTTLPTGIPETVEHSIVNTDEDIYNLKNRSEVPFNLMVDGIKEQAVAKSIMNPRVAHDGNATCVSCHRADIHLLFSGLVFDKQEQTPIWTNSILEILRSNSRITEVLPRLKNLPGFTPVDAALFRMFGYINDHPVISLRTATDNSKAVEEANLLSGLTPKSQCKSDKERTEVLECLLNNGFDSTVQACVKQICKD